MISWFCNAISVILSLVLSTVEGVSEESYQCNSHGTILRLRLRLRSGRQWVHGFTMSQLLISNYQLRPFPLIWVGILPVFFVGCHGVVAGFPIGVLGGLDGLGG
jgi:hypothetical protein